MWKLVFFLLISSFCFSQNEANYWYFGKYAGLNFNSGNPVAVVDGQLNTTEGCATISNNLGQLLFYTDGNTVWNKNHVVMQNGIGLLGNISSTQSAIIVPKPGSASIYYIFTAGLVSTIYPTRGIHYSEVDMSLDSGLGAVTATKNIQLLYEACEKLTAVKHGNNNDIWVIAHGWENDEFHSYLVSSAGVSSPVTSHAGIVVTALDFRNSFGYLKASPNGSKLFSCNYSLKSELFDYDNTTGIVSNPISFNVAEANSYRFYGAEFSPSGEILYLTADYTYGVFQYNLLASDIESSLNLIPSVLTPFALQLGPDGKMYSVEANFSGTLRKLGVINQPDILGTACDLQSDIVDLGTGIPQIGLPQFIQSYFNANITAQNFCLGSNTQFNINTSFTTTSIFWDFGDGVTSTTNNPLHQYAAAGNYTVTVTASDGINTINKNKIVTISPNPIIANPISNQILCGLNNTNYDLTQFSQTILGSQSTSIFGIAYFLSMPDAISHLNVLTNLQNMQYGTTTVYAKIYNLNNKSCNDIISFNVTLNQQPTANSPTEYIICENIPYDAVEQFNLGSKNTEILGTQNASDFVISYHATQQNADNNSSPLPTLYTNTAATETLFVRIENNLNTNCYATTTLNLKVIQQPTLIPISDFKICDDSSNDGVALFDLSQKTTEILNGQSASIFSVSYYFTNSDAQNIINPITSSFTNLVNNQEIFYAIQAVGNSNCRSIASFKLVVSKMPTATAINPYFICDDASNDEVGQFDLQSLYSQILGSQNATDFEISFHTNQNEADTKSNSLPLNYQNTANPQTIYVRIETIANTSCFETTPLQIGLYKMPIANTVSNMETCDDSNNNQTEIFDLSTQTPLILGSQSITNFNISFHQSQMDADSGTNALPQNFSNTVNPQTIYARIENKIQPACFDTVAFKLIVHPKPNLVMPDTYSICEGQAITINAPLGFSSYLWSNNVTTSYTNVMQPGNYSVTVSQNFSNITCSDTKNFTVVNSNRATIVSIDTRDWTDNENTIQVNATGDGDYEYSLDNIFFQDSNIFSGLSSGVYTVYVNDKNGCGSSSDEVFLLTYPKFFTPNADGTNDYWYIKFSNFIEPDLQVKIYDRYGKFITTWSANKSGWDGTYNGKPMPSDDYWFIVTRKNGKEYKGHFTLKR
jgi:gliding motility-associated-like protein